MSKKLYVGNLSFSSTEADLKELFERHGSVESVAVITDRETGRARGFALRATRSAPSMAATSGDGTSR
jgi:RNA recognition motif-containing protein